MKLKTLSQAIFASLTAIALTACGSSDNDIYTISTTPAVNPVETTLPAPAPTTTTTPVLDEATKQANLLQLAKLAGLTEANAVDFVAKTKDFTIDSKEYQDALAEARQAQQNAINAELAEKAKAVSPVVDAHNPFIGQVDVRETPTVGSSHYVRQQGSTYDRVSNPNAIVGLGSVATDDPTKSNPWLSNYVLGVEAIRQHGSDSPTLVAIDSAGEMAEAAPTLANPNAGAKLSGANSPYFTHYNGLRYRTQRSGGDSGDYNFASGATTANPDGNGAQSGNGFVRTIQEQTNQHGTTASQTHVNNALLAAKDRTILAPNERAGSDLPADGTSRNLDTPSRTSDFKGYFRSGLIVYASNSVPVGHKIGKELGHRVPMWGKEENIYQINPETDKLEVINGVEPQELEVLRAAITNPSATYTAAGSPTSLNSANWYTSRYGAAEGITNTTDVPPSNLSLAFRNINEDGSLYSPTATDANGTKQVANNDGARVYGKNMMRLEAGAEGQQLTDNTHVAKYDRSGTMLTNGIQPAKLHHVQYGRITNNIDVLAESEIGKKASNGGDRIVYRRFQSHGAPNSVDTYFYRGTNYTTPEQMKALGGIIQYHGHALTYNLGPFTAINQTGTSQGIPTAYGNSGAMTSGNTIGNFVEARFDVAKATLEGSIYNFLNEKRSTEDSDFKKQNLATFTGTVYGNTVIGTAQKVGVEGTGSLTASFFGPYANELGGNISSVSRGEGYGDAKWGAVFGATRGEGGAVQQFNVIEANSTRQ